MNSALKPVLSASQSAGAAGQMSKPPMHAQGAPAYGPPTGHMSQTPYPNMNAAHNHPSAQQNHFSISVPSASPHYAGAGGGGGGGGGGSMGAIPPSNHPVPNASQSSGQVYNPTKSSALYSGGFQPNLGHPPNQNPVPPVSQSLPAQSQSQQNSSSQNSSSQNSSNSSTPTSEISVESNKPQSNGTLEVKSSPKIDVLGSASVKDASSSPAAQSPQLVQRSPEKLKPSPKTQDKTNLVDNVNVKDSEEVKKNASYYPSSGSLDLVSSGCSSRVYPDSSCAERESSNHVDKQAKPYPSQTDQSSKQTAVAARDGSISKIGSLEAKVKASEKDKKSIVGATENAVQTAVSDSTKKEQQSPQKKESKTTLTSTPKMPVRKSKLSKQEESPKLLKAEAKVGGLQKSPASGKTKRQRTRTQPYQSPLPEYEIISKISSAAPRGKSNDDKLIYFYKNEFLAVRNAEGSFYLCQAVQNVYKSSSKIKIRWLSQEKGDKSGEIYAPDFYDLTDFDCILTSLDLLRVDKGKYRLTPAEKERTDSILKRCLAVEKGEISTPSLSEEHPDGLDLSLYKDEEQLKKRKGAKRKASRSSSKTSKKDASPEKSPDASKARKVEAKPTRKASTRTRSPAKKAAAATEAKRQATSTTRSAGGKKRAEKTVAVVDEKKARALAKIGRKAAVPATSRSQAATARSVRHGSKVSPSASSSAVKTASTTTAKLAAVRKTKRSRK